MLNLSGLNCFRYNRSLFFPQLLFVFLILWTRPYGSPSHPARHRVPRLRFPPQTLDRWASLTLPCVNRFVFCRTLDRRWLFSPLRRLHVRWNNKTAVSIYAFIRLRTKTNKPETVRRSVKNLFILNAMLSMNVWWALECWSWHFLRISIKGCSEIRCPNIHIMLTSEWMTSIIRVCCI